MRLPSKPVRRAIFGGVVLIAVAGIVAPFVNANRFEARVQNALQRSLGRHVEIGDVYFNLFSGPGFTIEGVTIFEDPAFGLEPFAHVERIDTRIALSTLWTGHLRFSHLRLIEPSVNLVRRSSGGWNLLSLIDHAAQGAGAVAGLPSIQVSSGRLYFKLDDTKSAFYLTDTDVEVSPRSGGLDGFDLSFRAQPSRTDRRAQGFATLSGNARLQPRPDGEPVLDVNLDLERTAMEEIVRLVRGHDFGVHGFMRSRAHIHGPLSNLAFRGQLRVEEIHRWDLMPSNAEWNLTYTGNIDWRGESAVLEVKQDPDAGWPVDMRMHLANYLDKPQWGVEVQVNGLAADGVVGFARHLGIVLPPELSVTGKVSGGASFDPDEGWIGELTLSDSELHLGGAPGLRLAESPIQLKGESMHFGPAAVTGDDGQSAELEFDYTPSGPSVDMRLRAGSLRIAEVQSGSGHLMSAAAVPFLEDLRRGSFSGWLRYRVSGDGPGRWTGNFELRDAIANVPGVADPVRLRFAAVSLAGERLAVRRLQARAGLIDFSGAYRYEPGSDRPDRFSFVAPQVNAGELERLLAPAIRREQSFLARTLRWRPSPPPAWLRKRHAEGTLRIGLFSTGHFDVRGLSANVAWDGTDINLQAKDGTLFDGKLNGMLATDLSGVAPQYRFEGVVMNAQLSGGKVDLDGVVESKGTGADLLLNLRASGHFDARALTMLPEHPVRTASGEFDFSIARGGPVLRVSGVQAALGSESYSGQATTLGDGTIRLDLASARRSMRFVGPLVPLRLDPAVAKP